MVAGCGKNLLGFQPDYADNYHFRAEMEPLQSVGLNFYNGFYGQRVVKCIRTMHYNSTRERAREGEGEFGSVLRKWCAREAREYLEQMMGMLFLDTGL